MQRERLEQAIGDARMARDMHALEEAEVLRDLLRRTADVMLSGAKECPGCGAHWLFFFVVKGSQWRIFIIIWVRSMGGIMVAMMRISMVIRAEVKMSDECIA